MSNTVSRIFERAKAVVTGRIMLKVRVGYDPEADIWHVVETDIPGLWLEAASAGELLDKLEDAAPEMMTLNRDQIMRRFFFGDPGRSGAQIDARVITPVMGLTPATC